MISMFYDNIQIYDMVPAIIADWEEIKKFIYRNIVR